MEDQTVAKSVFPLITMEMLASVLAHSPAADYHFHPGTDDWWIPEWDVDISVQCFQEYVERVNSILFTHEDIGRPCVGLTTGAPCPDCYGLFNNPDYGGATRILGKHVHFDPLCMPEISEGFDPAGLEKLSMLDLAGQVIKQASTTPTAAAPSQIQAGVLHAQDTGDDMMKYHFNALKSGRGIFG